MRRRVRTCEALSLAHTGTALRDFDARLQSATAVDRGASHAPAARMVCDEGQAGGGGHLSMQEHAGARAEHDTHDAHGVTPLLEAVTDHDLAGVRRLQHAQHDTHDAHGVTPLLEAVMHGDLAGVRRLLHAKASPHVPDSAGYPPLLVAVRGRRLPIARALVEAGACESAQHKLLPHALRTQQLPLVQLVLRAGCDYTLPEPPSESMRLLVEVAVRERWLAALMSLHARLGTAPECTIRVVPPEILQHVCLHWLRPAWLHTGVGMPD